MSKNREVRELQFSSTQLIVLFLAILVLGIFIFLLGVSVGKKQTRLTQEANLVRNPIHAPVKRPLPAAPTEQSGSGAIDKEIASHAQQSTAVKPGAQPQGKSPLTPSGKSAVSELPMTKTLATETKPAPAKTGAGTKALPQTTVPAKTKAATAPAGKVPTGTTRTTSTQLKTPPAKTAPIKAAEQIKGYYYVQLAAFDERSAAVEFSTQIKAAGFPSFVLEPLPRDKKPWYRVRVGGYPTNEEAERAVQQLRGVVTGRKFEYWITRD